MTEDTPGPLFASSLAAPYTVKDLSRAVAKLGVEYPTANARVSAYAKAGHIHVRERGAGATSPNRYALDDMAAAVLLSAVQDTGVADHDVLARVSTGLYSWTAGVKQTGHAHPTGIALAETIRKGVTWQLLIDFYRHLQTGERRLDVRFFRTGEINPNAPPPISEAEWALRKQHPDVQLDEHPAGSANYIWISRLQIPASELLRLLTPIVAPVGN